MTYNNSIASAIKDIAPITALMLTSPVGAAADAAITLLSKLFGSPSAQDLYTRISDGTNDKLVVEAETQLRALKMQLSDNQNQTKDTQDARQFRIEELKAGSTLNMPAIISIGVIILFATIFLIEWLIPITYDNHIFNNLAAIIAMGFGQVIQYYIGSCHRELR